MKDFVYIWMLFNTDWGKTLLGFLVVALVIVLIKWWTVTLIAVLLAALFLMDYFYVPLPNKRNLILGVSLLVFALLFSLGILFYEDIIWWYKGLSYHY